MKQTQVHVYWKCGLEKGHNIIQNDQRSNATKPHSLDCSGVSFTTCNTTIWWECFHVLILHGLFVANLLIDSGLLTHQCWCCRCEQWYQSEAVSSLNPWMLCHHPGNSQPGWLSGNCGCVIGSMLAWASLEAPSCPENGNENPWMWTQSCGPHNDGSSPGPVTGKDDKCDKFMGVV